MRQHRETVLQWNMDCLKKKELPGDIRRSRLDVLERLIHELSPGIVTLQEAPRDLRGTRMLRSGYRVIEGPNGIITAFREARWQVLGEQFVAKRRALVVKVDSGSTRQRLWVWNVHLPILWMDLAQRQTFARADLRDALAAARTEDPDRDELIVGDFNLHPYDDALVRRDGLRANRALESVRSERRGCENVRRPLFNPTWSLLGRVKPPYGSFYRKRPDNDGPWFVWDQALMSADLAVPCGRQVRLVERVGDAELCDGSAFRRPDEQVGSDHLPLRIDFRTA
jgi:hypothetical protein